MDLPSHLAASMVFTSFRQDPLRQSRFLQDIAVCRPDLGMIESVRLAVEQRKPDESRLSASHHVGDLTLGNTINARWFLPESVDEVQVVKARRLSKRIAAV